MSNRLSGLLITLFLLLPLAACDPAAGETGDAKRGIMAGPITPALAAVPSTTSLVSAQVTTPAASIAAPATTTTATPAGDTMQAAIDAGVVATIGAQATIDAIVAATVMAQTGIGMAATSPALPADAPADLPTAIPTPTATIVPTATPCQLTLTAALNAFVREGPSVQYKELGALQTGESATVIGRDASFSWWVIPFDGRHGWVSGEVVALSDCANYPGEVPASPLPTAVPTATLPPSPAATPPPVAALVVIDLLALAPEGHWETAQLLEDGHNGRDVNIIPFQGSGSSGSVALATRDLEDGTSRYVLRTHPKWVDNGTIKGWLPWVTMPRNAVFEAEVGYVAGAGHSDGVTFWVWEHHIKDGREVWNPVAHVPKQYNGRLIPLRIDLSHLAGQNVSIELRVDAGPRSGQDWAIWVAPRITGN